MTTGIRDDAADAVHRRRDAPLLCEKCEGVPVGFGKDMLGGLEAVGQHPPAPLLLSVYVVALQAIRPRRPHTHPEPSSPGTLERTRISSSIQVLAAVVARHKGISASNRPPAS